MDGIKSAESGGWGRYVRGAASELNRRYRLRQGIAGFISGTLPSSGLSSSASAGLTYLHALAGANDLDLSQDDFVELELHLENDYLGLRIGILDPATIVYGKKTALIYIDTRKEKVTLVNDPSEAQPYRFLIAYSGFSRELTSTSYNSRVAECYQAAQRLGRQVNLNQAQILSDIPAEVYKAYRHKLPPNLSRQADHYFGEVQRVELGRIAWSKGELEHFGELMNESCQSSIHRFESGSEPLKQLQKIVSSAPGVYGSRFSGGGFGGCVVGLVVKEVVDEAIDTIESRYRAVYPQMSDVARCFIARAEKGLRLI